MFNDGSVPDPMYYYPFLMDLVIESFEDAPFITNHVTST